MDLLIESEICLTVSSEQGNLPPNQVAETEGNLPGLVLRDFISILTNSANNEIHTLMLVNQNTVEL